MIFADSRYANGYAYKAYDAKNDAYSVTVRRAFPTESSQYYYYVWRNRDRMELVAAQQLGDSNAWWKIMDYNPEIIDGFNLAPGTVIRIPYDN